MKQSYFLFVLMLVFAGKASAQITNPGMESWTAGSPTGWVGYNDVATNFYTCVQSTDAHSGSLAAKLQVAGANAIGGRMNGRFAQNSFPLALKGFYKSSVQNNELLRIVVRLYNNTGGSYQDTLKLVGATSGYQPFTFTLDTALAASLTPDSARIYFNVMDTIGSTSILTPSSFILVDDLSWEPIPVSTLIENKAALSSLRIFPNPAEDRIFFDCKEIVGENVFATIYSSSGQLIKKERLLANASQNGQYSVLINDLAAGNYTLSIENSNLVIGSRGFSKK